MLVLLRVPVPCVGMAFGTRHDDGLVLIGADFGPGALDARAIRDSGTFVAGAGEKALSVENRVGREALHAVWNPFAHGWRDRENGGDCHDHRKGEKLQLNHGYLQRLGSPTASVQISVGSEQASRAGRSVKLPARRGGIGLLPLRGLRAETI